MATMAQVAVSVVHDEPTHEAGPRVHKYNISYIYIANVRESLRGCAFQSPGLKTFDRVAT